MNVLSFKQAETLMQGRLVAEHMNGKHTHTNFAAAGKLSEGV